MLRKLISVLFWHLQAIPPAVYVSTTGDCPKDVIVPQTVVSWSTQLNRWTVSYEDEGETVLVGAWRHKPTYEEIKYRYYQYTLNP